MGNNIVAFERSGTIMFTLMGRLTPILIVGAVAVVMLSSVAAVSQAQTAEPVVLFDKDNLGDWRGLHEDNKWMVAEGVSISKQDKKKFAVEDGKGILVNGKEGHTTNLLSKYEHGDCYLHIEFVVPHESNSGVYFQGLYEIQILDSYGKKDNDLEFSDCGAIYARYKDDQTYEGHPPRVNASRAPGEWQSFDAVFRAPRFDDNGRKIENAQFVAIVHNGILVHKNVELTGNTRASLDKPEAPKGPLMLQGDHGPVAYRNIVLVPLELD